MERNPGISFEALRNCRLCPHNCGVDRFKSPAGYCRTGTGYPVSSVCLHRGEEPVIKGKNGICNVFFAHCNLQCVYCQNYQISKNTTNISFPGRDSLQTITGNIIHCLDQGCEALGFVSPGHVIPQMVEIVLSVHNKGYHPVIIYNSNGYDKPDTLAMLENIVDVYLPDFKYSNSALAKKYSGAADYPETAKKALKEMFRQKGSNLIVNESGQAVFGMLIRHLVIPGQENDSMEILKWISDELSEKIYISLMSQYYPTGDLTNFKEIDRVLSDTEYLKVKHKLVALGLNNGWIQEIYSNEYYRPDFRNDHPFEHDN